MANLRTIQFLRNATLYDSLEAARLALIAKASTLLDGSPVVGRYSATTASGTEVRTILGIVANGTISFFNNTEEIDNVLQNLDFGPEGGSSSSVIDFIQQTDGKISATTKNVGELTLSGYTNDDTTVSGDVASTDTINGAFAKLQNKIAGNKAAIDATIDALDASSVSGDNKVVIDVTQENGQITATAANITGVKLAGYAEGTDADIEATDTLGQALGKLQAQINAMDKNADVVAGQVVTTVAEEDGKVTETKANVKDLQLGGYEKTNDTGAIASVDTINVALSKIENQIGANAIDNEDGSITVTTASTGTDIKVHIKTGEKVIKLDSNDGIYTDIDLVKITNGLPAEIKERYQLLASDDTQIGANIDIPKDSHIVSINYITTGEHAQNLEYVYVDVSGNTQTTYVDMSELVLEAEFASGITVTDHVAHGVVAPTSESFLTVGADGFKLAGVQDAIDAAVNALDADKSGSTTHVGVRVEEVDGKITAVTVSEDDIASAQGLADEITARTAADTALSDRLGTGVTSANTATAQFAALSGDTASTSADTSVEGAKRYADTILANSVAGLDADKSGSTAHVTVGVLEVDGVISAVTVSEDNIANADDLAGLSGKTITAISSSNGSITANIDDAAGCKSYNIETDSSKIKLSSFTESSGTTDEAPANGDTINEALAKIYSAAKHHHITSANNALTAEVTTSGTTLTVKVDNETAHSAADDTYASNNQNMIQIKDGGLYVSSSIDCGVF